MLTEDQFSFSSPEDTIILLDKRRYMGSGQSTHVTDFERPPKNADNVNLKSQELSAINISNKMVERLVVDVAQKPKQTAQPQQPPKSVFKDRYFNDKLNSYDEQHSRQWGLTVKDMKTIANRIERTSNPAVNPDPICAHCAEKVLDCYKMENVEPYVCTGAVETFNDCVRKAIRNRVHERTKQAARNEEERSRNIARAKENVLQKFSHEEGIAA